MTRTQLLVVDDDQFNVLSVLRAAKTIDIANPIVVAYDGSRALRALREWLKTRSGLPPLIILLDLNMPVMSGLEFLDEIRSDPLLKRAHVFVYSTSSLPSEISAAYERNVTGYIVKGSDQLSTQEVVKMLANYADTVRFAF